MRTVRVFNGVPLDGCFSDANNDYSSGGKPWWTSSRSKTSKNGRVFLAYSRV